MATLNVKNLPDALYKKLKARAKRERRSVAQEVTYLLTAALDAPQPLSILDLQGLGKELWTDVDAAAHIETETKVMGLIDDLGPGRIGVDTAIFIYYIEAAPAWLPVIAPLFLAADLGHRELVTSAVTLPEVLLVPYRANNLRLASSYEALPTRSRGIRLIDVTRDQLRQAAQLRAVTGVRTPDALQLTAALDTGCTAFVTNARRLPAMPGLRIVQLASYAE